MNQRKSISQADALRLIHELQAHQIELEMKNEELVQARAEAQEAYRQYTDLYDFAPVGYFTLARDGAILETNLAGATLLGVERAKLIKRRLGLFVAQASRPVLAAFLERLITCEGKQTCELMFEKKEGEFLWARFEATCFEGGQECRAALIDITERKRVEQSLQKSEAGYRELIELAVDGILLGSSDGIIIGANSCMLKLSGRNLDDLLGKHLNTLFSPDELKKVPLRFDLLQEGETVTNERKLTRSDGTIVPVEMRTKMMPDGRYQSIFRDITERKLAEEALRAAGQQWQDTFDAIGDSISLIDLEWRVIKHNRATQVLLGKSATEIDGQNCYEVMHGTSQPIENCPFQRMKKSKHRESLILELNGRWINITVDPMFNSSGQLIGATHIASDITERMLADKALQTSEANLKAIFENSLQSFMLIDKNRTIQSFNGKASKNVKARFGEEIQPGDSMYKIVSPRKREDFDKNFERALAGEIIRVEKMFEAETGILWLEFHYAPVLTKNEISGVFLSALNITERKQVERELRESEKNSARWLSNPVMA